jgi:hypothetical protein
MVTARTDRGIVVFDPARSALTFPNGEAASWAPGELLGRGGDPERGAVRGAALREVVTLPLAVRDLEWVVP